MSACEGQNVSIQQQIDRLESLLASGANSITIDGISTSLNHDSLRQQVRDLKRRQSGRNPFLQVRFTGGYDGY